MRSADARVGPYQILKPLGQGAMGVVFLAEDVRLGRRVALKTLSERDRTPAARERLLHEARMLAQLKHPNVAVIHHFVESGDGVHVVMEYVPGQTLAAELRHGALPVEEAVTVGVQLAEALGAAHRVGVIHRDLKPANVMVTRDASAAEKKPRLLKATVLDFGLAQTSGAAADGEQLSGTAGYLAPEAVLGAPPDARSDIYSLGVILFEMMTGERPFPGRDMRAVATAALEQRAPLITDLDPRLPPALAGVVSRALMAAPDQRFASAMELAEALQAVDAAASTPTRAIARPPPDRRRSRLRYWISAAAAVAAVSSGGLVVTPRPPPVHATSAVVAVLPLLNATGDPSGDEFGAGIADVLISTLAQVPGVTMVSRDATLDHGSRRQPVSTVARALGADLVVDGIVRKSGDTARVTLSLLRPGSNLIAWTRTYDAAFKDMFTLQNEAASALSEALQVTLTPEQRRRIERAPTTNAEALADYAQGRAFLERRDVARNVEHSIKLLQGAITKDPRFARAHAALGQAYWMRFRETRDDEWADKALLETTESLRLDPEDASVHHALAVVLDGRGRKIQAIEELRRAITLQPGNDEAHSLLGQILCDQGRRDEGVAELRRAITLRPNYWGHHYALGVAQFDAGRYPEAAAAFRRVSELQPDSSRGFLMLGTTQHAAGDSSAAIETFRRALAIAPDAAVHTNMGTALLAAGRLHEAARAFEEAARLAPRSPIKQRNLGDVYRKLGNAAMARKAYERAAALCREELRTNPRDARVLSWLAVYEAKVGRHADAIRHADEAVALGAQMADVMYWAAVAQSLAGHSVESVALLEKAFALGYSRQMASADEDLSALHGRSDFKDLVAESSQTSVKGGGT